MRIESSNVSNIAHYQAKKINKTDTNQAKRRADSKDKDSDQGNRCDVEKNIIEEK